MLKIFCSLLLLALPCLGQNVVRIGTPATYAPYESIENGTLVGFDIDIIDLIFKAAGLQYNITNIPFPQLGTALRNGSIDVAISDLNLHKKNNVTFDFSAPYLSTSSVILAPNNTNISYAKDLFNRNVAVVHDTLGETQMEYISGGDNANILHFDTTQDAIDALNNGTVDAYVDDLQFTQNWIQGNASYAMIQDNNYFYRELQSFMYLLGNQYVDAVNKGIATVLANGSYSTIYQKWFWAVPDVDLLQRAGKLDNPYDVFSQRIQLVASQ